MNKKMWAVVIILVLLAVIVSIFFGEQRKAVAPTTTATTTTAVFDPSNAPYVIDGATGVFADGQWRVSPGAGETVPNEGTTTIFEVSPVGDLNGDGKPDAGLIIVQDPGGSGTFYYVAAAINTPNGAMGTNAVFLGDRIAPQNISIANERIVVNYADRSPSEPMSTPPSHGITKYFIYQSSTLVEAAPEQ